LAPIVLSFIFVGAFQGSSQWGDIITLFAFSCLGFGMKRMGWPRPPLILGFVLGALLERYTSLSVARYDMDWIYRPIVLVVLALAALSLLWPPLRKMMSERREPTALSFALRPIKINAELAFIVILLIVFGLMIVTSADWPFRTRLMPQAVAVVGIATLLLMLARKAFAVGRETVGQTFDIADDLGDMPKALITRRALVFAAWGLFFVACALVFGFIAGLFLFMLAYVHWDTGKSWSISLAISMGTLAFNYLLFHLTLHLVWPQSAVSLLLPTLRSSTWTGIF
jgi:hypothetical protein